MNVVILGSGAMGCLYGAALHRAGCAVTLVDVNREHIEAIIAAARCPSPITASLVTPGGSDTASSRC